MATHIRRAKPDDADFLAWAMLTASRAHLPRGVWDLIIGADEQGRLDYLRRLAVAELGSLCHYEAFLVADVDGEFGAALSGFEFRTGGWAAVGTAMTNVQHDLGWTESDVAASHNRVAPVWACFLPDIGADWGIENIATRPDVTAVEGWHLCYSPKCYGRGASVGSSLRKSQPLSAMTTLGFFTRKLALEFQTKSVAVEWNQS